MWTDTQSNVGPSLELGMVVSFTGIAGGDAGSNPASSTFFIVIIESLRTMDKVFLDEKHVVEWVQEKGIIVGFFFTHPHSETGEECGGYVPLGRGEWNIHKVSPLHISPSINCTECDSHGNIIGGKWHEHTFEEKENLLVH